MAGVRNPIGLDSTSFAELKSELKQIGKELEKFDIKKELERRQSELQPRYEILRRERLFSHFIRNLTSEKIQKPLYDLTQAKERESFAYHFNQGYKRYIARYDLVDSSLLRSTPEKGACDIRPEEFALVKQGQYVPPLLFPYKESGRTSVYYTGSDMRPPLYRYDTECFGENCQYVINVPKNRIALVLIQHPDYHVRAYSEGAHIVNTVKPDYQFVDLRVILQLNHHIRADERALKALKHKRDQLVTSLSLFSTGSQEPISSPGPLPSTLRNCRVD